MIPNSNDLIIENLQVSVGESRILKGVDLSVRKGEIHALMGPNGSGKSTLANVLMGHPEYKVIEGSVTFNSQDILKMSPNERAEAGIFLAFQYPLEIPGVSVQDFLRTASLAIQPEITSFTEFAIELDKAMTLLRMDISYLSRSLNEGFSGGEKKRAEILQMMMLKPKLAILDETDSGLDIDALRIVAEGINSMRGDNFSALIITHYKRILEYIEPDMVHIMHNGQIALSGDKNLVDELEAEGYEFLSSSSALAG